MRAEVQSGFDVATRTPLLARSTAGEPCFLVNRRTDCDVVHDYGGVPRQNRSSQAIS